MNATKDSLKPGELDKYIDGIYDGEYTVDNLPEFVYDSIVDYLKKGLYQGWGKDYTTLLKQAAEDEGSYGKDLELLSQLRENVYMFGAAKTYSMTKDISGLLFDEDGELRTNKEFNEIARETYANWNDNWGETEYSTAVGQAYAAQQWNEIEKTKDILPNLRYSAIGDACPICLPFDGLTRPVADPIWNVASPLNHFNCKCLLLQEDEESTLTAEDETEDLRKHADEKIDDIFASNPGKDGMVFNEHHPYFEEARADKAGADNFGFPIPDKDGKE